MAHRWGLAGWVGLALTVVGIDVVLMRCRQPTLSATWRHLLLHPHGRVCLGAGWLLLTAHLFWGVP